METIQLEGITLQPKTARNGKKYFLVHQENGNNVCWFESDWLKIKSAFKEGNLSEDQRVQVEQRGSEIVIHTHASVKTFSLVFSSETWNELQRNAYKLDELYQQNKITFYTWSCEDERAHCYFLKKIDCELHAARNDVDLNQLHIQESQLEIPEKHVFIKYVYLWILHRQIDLMIKHRCSGCFINAPSQDDHECLVTDQLEYYFDIIERKMYVYWSMVYEMCLKIQKKTNILNFQLVDCCIPFDNVIQNNIKNNIVYDCCPDEFLCLFKNCYDEMN